MNYTYTHNHPVWYGKWRIYNNYGFCSAGDHTADFAFVHDNYDGGFDGHDHRFGYAATIDACKDQIDIMEDES